ncbi:MAG: N-acetylmuramoyl-L-alanine amidase [Candidatus Eisenbacteria bacterium]
MIMNAGRAALVSALVVAVTLVACAPKHRPPVSLLYEGREEALKGLDATALPGRTIVIDPGHGGVFRGARGVGGLDEADVNLGVALFLWGLLEEAGAEVSLTRTTDRDFVDGDSLRLKEDLQARVDIVENIKPELFISLHHNAGVSLDTTFNEIQVYYKMTDKGPSLDLANIVGRHLLKNIGEPKTRVIPGNYYVLRNTTVPSILCEPSYITNTRVESKLKLSNKQRLEAEIYFLALVDYFSRGVFDIVKFGPVGAVRTGTPVIRVDFDDLTMIDAQTVEIDLDGTRLTPFKIDRSAFAAFPTSPLRGGRHTVSASARAITGNSSPVRTWDFTVDLEPDILRVAAHPAAAQAPYPQKIVASVFDGNGNPVADSTAVVFSWKDETSRRPTVRGSASTHAGREIPFGVGTVTVSCGKLTKQLSLATPPPETAGDKRTHYVSGFVRDGDGHPLKAATVTAIPPADPAFTDRDGYFLLEAGTVPGSLHISKPGYKDMTLDLTGETFPVAQLDKFYHSIDPGTVVTLDAAGGGEETGWVGPAGTKASELNLALARRISGYLSSAGIEARLTRRTDTRTGKEDRVARCEAWNSTVVLSVSHTGGARRKVGIEHYPGSSGGTRLSEYLGEEIAAVTGYDTAVGETAEYLVRQTSCPAVKVTFVTPPTLDDEASLSEPVDLWRRAYAAFSAIARYLGVEEHNTFSVSGKITRAGKAVTGGLVLVDGCFETIVDKTGGFNLNLLEHGLHTAVAYSGGVQSDRVEFDESTGPLLIELH